MTPNGKKPYIAQIRSQDAIHIADPEKGNPTDPLNWIDAGGQATLEDGHKYVAVFLATHRQTGSNVDLNSPCVEFEFTVGNAPVPPKADEIALDFDGDGQVKMPEDFFSVYDQYLSYWENEEDTVGEDATKKSLDFNENDVLDMIDLQKVFAVNLPDDSALTFSGIKETPHNRAKKSRRHTSAEKC